MSGKNSAMERRVRRVQVNKPVFRRSDPNNQVEYSTRGQASSSHQAQAVAAAQIASQQNDNPSIDGMSDRSGYSLVNASSGQGNYGEGYGGQDSQVDPAQSDSNGPIALSASSSEMDKARAMKTWTEFLTKNAANYRDEESGVFDADPGAVERLIQKHLGARPSDPKAAENYDEHSRIIKNIFGNPRYG
jgi:hypothetical protein